MLVNIAQIQQITRKDCHQSIEDVAESNKVTATCLGAIHFPEELKQVAQNVGKHRTNSTDHKGRLSSEY